jgi:4-amino-4-deoxy-L-arabinose transferase-like glycosyltransferase
VKKYLFFLILIIAIALRFYNLGIEPASLDWDEASLGYNSYSLLLNGSDEFGNSWPLSIRSFNDYKPPGYSYLGIIPTAIFGLNEFSTRFPSALFGVLTVVSVYFLTKEFFDSSFNKNNILKAENIALVSMFIFAISPWHLQFSRAAFEGNIAVFFVTTGMLFTLKWLRTNNPWFSYVAVIFFGGAMYAYHAARLVIPVLLFGMALRYRKFFLRNIPFTASATFLLIILISPLIITLTRGTAASRFSSVSIFNPENVNERAIYYNYEDKLGGQNLVSLTHNKYIQYTIEFIGGYISHYNAINMFLVGDSVERHHAPDMGLFYLVELPFILIGIVTLIKTQFKYKFIFFYWVAIAPIPAAISTGNPHAIRSILFLPLPQIAIAIGLLQAYILFSKFKSKLRYKAIAEICIALVALVFLFNFAYYLNQYHVHQSKEYAAYWQYGYREMIEYVKQNESKYRKVVVTTAYDQPYIYFLYYKKYDPRIWVNNGDYARGFDKYEFRKVEWESDRKLYNTLLVGHPLEVPEKELGTLEVIKFPGGNDTFRIIASQN